MDFRHLRPGLTSLVGLKHRCLSTSFRVYEKQPWISNEKETAFIRKPISFHINPIIGTQSRAISFASMGSSETKTTQSSRTHFERAGKILDDPNRFNIELHELLREAQDMMSIGDRDSASKLLRANYLLVKEKMESGSNDTEVLAFLNIIIMGYVSLGGHKKIIDSMVDEMNMALDGLKDDDHRTLIVLNSLASTFYFLQKYDKAVPVLERLIKINEKRLGKNSDSQWPIYCQMATSLVFVGKGSQAKEYCNRLMTILESNGDIVSESLSMVCDLGNMLIEKGKSEDAENLFLRILDSLEKFNGKCCGTVGKAICGVANAKHAMGDIDEAIRWSRKAIQVTKDSMAISEVEAATIITYSAKLLNKLGRGQECLEILQESLHAAEGIVGKEHPSSVEYMNEIAVYHHRSKDYIEAEQILRTLVQIMSKVLGPDDPNTGYQMLYLSSTLLCLERYEESDQLASKALKTIGNFYGEDSSQFLEALGKVVSRQSELLRHDESLLEKLKWLLRIQEESSTSDEILKTLEKMAICLDKLGRKEEKLAVEQKRLAMVRKLQDLAV